MHLDVKRAILATRVLAGQPASRLAAACPGRATDRPHPTRPRWPALARLAACALLAAGSVGAAPSAAPGFLDLRISPDGSHLAALVELLERPQLVVVRRSDGAQQRVTESFPGRIERFFWANGDRLVFTSADDTGLYGVDRDGTALTALIAPSATRAAPRLVDPLAADPAHILIALPLTPSQDAVHRLHVGTGQLERLALPLRNAQDWHVDRTGVVRVVVLGAVPAPRVFYRADAAAAWEELGAASAAPPAFALLGLAEDDRRLVVAGPTEAGQYTVQLLDPARGEWQALAPDLPTDRLPALRRAPTRGTLIALDYANGEPRQQLLAPFWRALFRTVDDALPDSRNLLHHMSDDERTIIVLSCSDTARCAFHLLDRRTGGLEFLGQRTDSMQALPAGEATQARAPDVVLPAH